ncbi:MAG: cell division protein FtsZ [Bacteroidota bacterium]|nr:cell division protein FtsZ [Bacteroidota bacterium]MDP3144116.1 cell division protein FtsZ [Bacteroidota bacterium]MDP3558161.1 cell division protein FtsZ [Bacteroidota bacterium]
MQFELPQEDKSIIKVIGVGGGGSNAVNHMYRLGIKGVDFIVCNTDKQALEKSPVPFKIQLGELSTKGLGAGSIPDVGRDAALESIDEIKSYLTDSTQMVFITAGLGGGTGTGAAPVIASVAKELGILTVGIVTIPFSFEGKKRRAQAEAGLEEMKKYVDTLLVIGNDKLREIYGNLKMSEAFEHADDVLTGAAKSIAEIISLHMHINVDFNDVKTVMKDSGVAIMGSAIASGEKRAIKAVEQALNSPLLNDNDISGARHVLLNIMSGTDDIDMDEFGEITDYIQEAAGGTAELITGYGTDASLGDNVSVTIIATGFKSKQSTGFEAMTFKDRKVVNLDEKETEAPVAEVVQTTIIDEIQKVEPFVFIKEETIETQKEINSVSSLDEIQNETDYTVTSSVEETKTVITEFTFNEVASEETKTVSNQTKEEPTFEQGTISREEQIKLAQDRIRKLKEITLKMKSPEGLAALEKQTAFERKNISLEHKTPSTESSVSRFTLGESDDKKIEIRPNNSFLHDNVD